MYRFSDALLPPGLLSASRVPLAALFPAAVSRGAGSAALVIAAAGLTDVLDGFCARQMHLATPTGAAVDAIADKLFVGGVLGALVAARRLRLGEAALLAVREVAEVPLTLWFLASGRARRASHVDHPCSNGAG